MNDKRPCANWRRGRLRNSFREAYRGSGCKLPAARRLDTPCRTEFNVSYSKQRIGVTLTRHTLSSPVCPLLLADLASAGCPPCRPNGEISPALSPAPTSQNRPRLALFLT